MIFTFAQYRDDVAGIFESGDRLQLVDIYEDDPTGLIMRDADGRADLVWPLELAAPVVDPVCSFLLARYGAPKGGAL